MTWTVDKVGELLGPLVYQAAADEWRAGIIGDLPVTDELQGVADRLNAAAVASHETTRQEHADGR